MTENEWLNDNQLSLDIWHKKYQVKDESFEEWLDRVSGGDQKVRELIKEKKFLFGGRILSNRGTDRGAYSNCNSLGYVEDSLVDIMQANTDLALTYKAQGGQGLSLSKLRPKGTLIHHNFQSDGIIPFMEMFNITTKSISQGGNRRGALLLALDIWHKEALDFAKIKSNLDSINNANLSLEVDDKFMSIIDNYYKTGEEPVIHIKRDYEGNEVEYDVEPVKLYKEICKYSRNTAEPGILFMDRMKKYNMAQNHSVYRIECTNACSEIPMSKHGACLTGDTLISTFNGSRKIKDLKEEYIFGTDDKLHKYLEVKSKGIKHIYEITFNNGLRIKGTEDHLLEKSDGSFIKMIDSLGEDIKIFTPKSNIIIGETSSFYEMLGWIHGDGWFSSTLGISFNKKDGDYEIKDKILSEFINYFEVTTKPNRDDEVGYSIQTDCKKSIEKALQLGMHEGKANQREFPDCFYTASDVEQRSFIRGLFSADGCVSGKSNKQVKYSSSSLDLIKEIQVYLSSIGIHSSLYSTIFKTCKRPNQYNLVISKESAMRFMDIIGFLYSKKTNKFNFSESKIYKDESFYTVTKIEEIGEEEVFDIHNVESISTFYANGIAVHNCILGSINLKEYVDDPYTSKAKIRYDKLIEDIPVVVRAMDDIVTENQPRHVLPGQAKVAETYRNVGIGIMGLNDLFVRLGLKYGSPESIALAGHIMKLIFKHCVLCSVALAKERGSFPGYESNIWNTDIIKNNFTEEEIEQLKEEDCLRNLSLVSIAPTGSIGTMLGVSTGAESFFALSFMRRTVSLDGDKEHFYKVDIDAVKEYKEITGDDSVPNFFVGANDIPWKERVDMQAALQNSVDQAISSTINLPRTTTAEDIEQLYLYAWKKGLKGVTIFTDGSREPILSKEVKPKEITRCGSPKRPSVLPCDIYSVKVKGEVFIVCVGLYNDQPYEVFVFRPDDPTVKITNNKGTITKKAKGVYSLNSDDFNISNILKTNITIEEKAATLYSSMLLRHGITLKYIIKTAKKVNDNISSFSSAMTRILSKYLPKDTGEPCPECGEMLIRTGGCISCPSCGYSRCE